MHASGYCQRTIKKSCLCCWARNGTRSLVHSRSVLSHWVVSHLHMNFYSPLCIQLRMQKDFKWHNNVHLATTYSQPVIKASLILYLFHSLLQLTEKITSRNNRDDKNSLGNNFLIVTNSNTFLNEYSVIVSYTLQNC